MNLLDYGAWPGCFTGPDAGQPKEGCTANVDSDFDGDADLRDWSRFQSAFGAFVCGQLFPGPEWQTGRDPDSAAVGDLDGDGDLDLAVANSYDRTVSVLLNAGNRTFAPQVTYGTGSDPVSVTVGDLDGDSDLDVVVANNGSHSVSVLLNEGTGTFATHVTYPTGTSPRDIAAGDLDGDKDLDLAVGYGSTASVLLNNGDGTFAPQVIYAAGINPSSIAVGDLDGDTDSDVILTGSARVSVLFNNGNGMLSTPVISETGVTAEPAFVIAADLDGDHDLDLAVANRGGATPGKTVSVLLNNGDGTFASPVAYGTGNYPRYIAAGDLDADNDLDLAVSTGNDISVLLNNGNGTYANHVTYDLDTPSNFVVIGDLDGNKDPDLFVANDGGFGTGDTVSALLNNGNGTFAIRSDHRLREYSYPRAVAASDFDGDSDMDLAVANDEFDDVSILLNTGNGGFAEHTRFTVGVRPTQIIAGDWDGDADVDLAVAVEESNGVAVLRGNGDGSFATRVIYNTGAFSRPTSVAAADLDGDGDLDLAVANNGSNIHNVSVLLNNGNGTFASHVTYATGRNSRSVVAGDLDGDNDLDLAVANGGRAAPGNTVSVLLNNGNGTFASHATYDTGTAPWSTTVGDLDGDNDLDIAVANYGTSTAPGNTVSVLLNNGDGTFTTHVAYATGSYPVSVAAGDLDGDSDMDLVVANHGFNSGYPSYTVSVLLNCGNATFGPHLTYGVGAGPGSVAVADLDGNFTPDLAVTNVWWHTVSVLRNLCIRND